MTITAERTSDFTTLSQRIKAAGLLDRRPGYYAVRLTLVAALYVGGWVAFATVGASWWVLAIAAVLAVAYAQVALVAHDLAHKQVFKGRRWSEALGMLVGNLGIGMSYGWWMNKHTRHHANPNHEDHDPDVAPDILVWSTRQAENAKGLARLIGGHQAQLFFPLLLLEGFNLHVSSARAIPGVKRRWLEGILLYGHIALYLAAAFLLLPPGMAIAFILVHQALFGLYLGCTFAPNHKGMPMLTAEDELDFLRKQVLTSRNVRGGVWVDVVLGGLNYQIEHHLFPNMPTPNLRKAQPIVEAHCREIGVHYESATFVDSYAQALRHLHAAGAPLRG
ncbi:fatty acid desaturase family protein [Dactylosporangium sucinum]|uniref:Delta fatty acid desaturase n=1 Tax=Dactylosporangium sucinum TaxID=1424081 RepID=A0A917TRA6_9ACTN|nr:acyl-CoA desaturase [Dactylosporangium sucinum]GGM33246.1 delta fatty acid desaturase [Dactylosporangium sucinum]